MTMFQPHRKLINVGAIWGFIVLPRCRSSSRLAGQFHVAVRRLSSLISKHAAAYSSSSASHSIIGCGMTVIMINGNIDLSVGAISCLLPPS